MRRYRLAFAVALLLLPALPAPAQSTMGSVVGTVWDQAGKPLSGVSVVLRSPQLQGELTAVTGPGGGYRVANLNPGLYGVVFTLPGFQQLELEGVQVNIGTAVEVEATLPTAFAEEVVVTSESRLVNTTTTTLGLSLTPDLFLDLPVARDITAIASRAPGAQDDASGQAFYGSTGAENAYFLDGVNTTSIQYGQRGAELNFEFIQEVQATTGGYSAEYGHSTGAVINVITRSGGNEFHGDTFVYWDDDALRSSLTGDAEQGRISGASTTVDITRSDYGADLGGYLVRDRLWFFVAYDRVENDTTIEALADAGAVVPGAPMAGDRFPWDNTQDLFAAKLTWRPSADQSVAASLFGDPGEWSGASPDYLLGAPATYEMTSRAGGTDGALSWDGVLGENVVVSARLATHQETSDLDGPGAEFPPFVDYSDPLGDGSVVYGWGDKVSGWIWDIEQDFVRDQVKLDLSYFVDDLAGRHELKIGAEHQDISVHQVLAITGPYGTAVLRWPCDPEVQYCGENNEHQYYFLHAFMVDESVDDPNQATLADALKVQAVDTPSDASAVFLQDRWQPVPSLSLDFGVRWSRQRLFNAAGGVQADIDDSWAPRIGFAWDFLGNGSSKLFGHYGRFFETIPMDIVVRSFAGEKLVWTYNFSDDPADVVQPPPGEAPLDAYLYGGGFSPVDPDLKGQYLSEVVLGADLEVATDVVVGLRLIRRDLDRVVEDALAEEGGFFIGNPGEGMLTETYDIASSLGWTCPDGTYDCHVKPVPLPRRQFTGVEASIHKRFSNRFQLLASALWSRLEGNYDGNFQASTGQLDPNLNSAYDFADFSVNNDGLLSNDRPWQLKLDGVYHFDLGLAVGLSAYYRSGTPVTAMGYSLLYAAWEYYLSRRGAFGRTDSEYEANLHLGYPVRLGGGVELKLLLDVFNLLDRQGETARSTHYTQYEDYAPLDWATGVPYPPITPGDADRPPTSPEWNTTIAWQDPRTIRVGARLSF